MLWYQFYRMVDAGKIFDGVEYDGRAWSEQCAGSACDYCAVLKLDRRACHAGLFGTFSRGGYRAAELGVDLGLLEEQSDLIYFLVAAIALREAVEGCEVAPNVLV